MTGNYEKRDGEIFAVHKVKVKNIQVRIRKLESERDHARNQIKLWTKTAESTEAKLAELKSLIET